MARVDRIAPWVSASHRFIWGLSLLVLFLFSHGILSRLLFALLFALLARLAGKRIRYTYFLILTLSITLFHLLSPFGEILYSLGGFEITRGALLTGLTKGITISGLVFVSLFSVSRNLSLPGRFGRLLGRSFYYFERLYGEKRRVSRKSFLADVDRILLSLFPSGDVGEKELSGGQTRALGWIMVVLSYLCVAGAYWVSNIPAIGALL